MVLEGIVVDVLLKYLGDYIKDLNREQLKIGLFSGNVVLKDLEVKGEALESLNLPVTVKKGVLGKLELRVPWKNLKNQPVVVLLDNIFILVKKQNQFEYDEEEATKRKKNRKKKRLESYEALSEVKEEDKKEKSFSERLVTKILDNLQILINKIHIRFEDEHEGKTFALGLTIDRISLQSTDDKWKPTFVDSVSSTIMKLVELSDMSIYMDTEAKSLANLTHAQFYDTFAKLIPTGQAPVGHHFLLNPISAWLKLSLANNRGKIDMDIPKATISAAIEEISLSLEGEQYHTLLGLIESLNFYVQETKYLKFRPKERPTKDPRGWWKYAGNVVIESIRERLNRKSWVYLVQRSKIRHEYIQLYKSSSGVKWHAALTKAQAKRLEELDDQNSFEDIVYFRSLAKAELQQEAQNKERRHEFKKLQKKKLTRRSRIIGALFSSDDKRKSTKIKDSKDSSSSLEITDSKQEAKRLEKEQKKREKEIKKKGKEEKKRDKEDKKKGRPTSLTSSRLLLHVAESNSPRLQKHGYAESGSEASDVLSHVAKSEVDSDDESNMGEAPGILLSPQEKQMLYETIGFDQALDVLDEKLPPEYVKTKMNIEVGRVSFSLIGRKPNNTIGPLAAFSVNDIVVAMEKRAENMLLNLTVDNIEATDMLVANPKFSKLIARSKKSSPQQKQIENGSSNSNKEKSAGEATKFVQFRFEKKPLDGHADLVIHAKMSPLDIIINPSSVVHFYTFFRPPQPIAVWALAGRGKRQWDDIKKRTRHQLMDVLKARNTIDLTVDARAPTIFIPGNSTQSDTVMAIADLGTILITSTPNRKRYNSDIDPETMQESEFYDTFRFSVSGVRVLATTGNDQGWQDPTDNHYAQYDFVHTDVNLLMEKSINPHEASLTQMKLSGELPLLRVHFSTYKLGLVVQLANALDSQLAPLKDMSGGFKTQSVLEEGNVKVTKAGNIDARLEAMLEGVDEEERELVKQQLIEQKQIEVKFSIGSIEVELCQTTDEGNNRIIAKLKLVGLSLDLVKQLYNLQGEVVVHGIQLQDFVTPTDVGKFKNLIYSSENFADAQEDLIKGSFLKMDRYSPDFKGAFTTLSFAFTTLHVAINPVAIQTIVGLITECVAATTQLVSDATHHSNITEESVPPVIYDQDSKVHAKNVLSKVKLDASFVRVAILLNYGGTHLATFSISGIDAEVDVKETKTVATTATIQSIKLVDETAAQRPHSQILVTKTEDGDPGIIFGFHKLPPPPILLLGPHDTLAPHSRLEIAAHHLHLVVSQVFISQLLDFSLPFIAMLPGRATAPGSPRTQKQKTYSTLNTLVSPFQKAKDKKPTQAQAPERKRLQLDIRTEVCHVFLPENDNSRSGVALSLSSATLFTTFSSVSTPMLDFGAPNLGEDEDELDKEVVVIVNNYALGASDMGLQIVRVDDRGEEARIQMLADVQVKMGMYFLVGNVPKSILMPSKRISIELPKMKMKTDPEKMGIIFRGIMTIVHFSKRFQVLNPKTHTDVPALSYGFTPPASPLLDSGTSTPRSNTATPVRNAPKNHLALLNRIAIKIDITLHAVELEAESGPDVFSEMELKDIWLGIDIRETRQVLVTGKVHHMEVFDVMPTIIDGKSIPRKATVAIEQTQSDTVVEFTVSKKRDAAAYVELQVRPLHLTVGVEFFGKILTYVVPLSQAFRFTPPPDSELASSSPSPLATPFRAIPRPALMPRFNRSNSQLGSAPATPPSTSLISTPKAVRPEQNRRESFANERPSSLSSFSPLRPSSNTLPSPHRPRKEKSFFRLRVENVAALVLTPGANSALLFDVGSVLVYNEMATKNGNMNRTPSKSQDGEDDIVAETQVEQMRKIVVKTTHVNARVCESDQSGGDMFQSGQSRAGYVLKDAQIDIGVEARENEHDKTGTIPRKKILIQTTDLLFMLTQNDYDILMSIADGLLKNLVRKKPTHASSSQGGVDQLVTEIFIDVPDLQLAVKGELNNIATFRLNLINFSMLQFASKTMKLDALVNSFNIIDTRPSTCTEFSRIMHGKQNSTIPMIKFKMQRVPATGTLTILFNVDNLRLYANVFAILDIMDFFLPALSEKLLPNFTEKAAAPKNKPPSRVLSLEASIVQAKFFVVEDFAKRTSGILSITTDATLEFVDRNRDAKVSFRLQQFHIGTIHHQISSQKASVLHSASIDFVMSNSQGTATSITLILDTLPLFLSPQDDVRPIIPVMKSKFKNIRKQKEKAVSEPVEKEEILVVSCIGGIILTAMNDHMGRALPMAEVRLTQISAQLSNWSAKRLELETNMVLLVEYFNSSIMSFEPLVEKWPVGFTLKQSNNPKFTLVLKSGGLFNLNITHAFGQMLVNSYDVIAPMAGQAGKIFKNKRKRAFAPSSASLIPSPSSNTLHLSSSSTASGTLPPPPASSSLLENTEEAELAANVASDSSRKDFLRPNAHLLTRLNASGALLRSQTPPPNSPAASSPLLSAQPIKKLVSIFHPYWIYNQTGYSILYLTDDDTRETPDEVAPSRLGDRLRFPMDNVGKNTGRTRNFRQSEEENSLTMTVKIPYDSSTPIRRVPVDTLGSYYFKAGNNMQEKMCCEVSWNDDGSKNVTVRSCVVLRNFTDTPLEFRVSEGSEARTLGPQAPGESLAVPVQLAQTGALMIRPASGNFRTNDTLLLSEMHEAISSNQYKAMLPAQTRRSLNLAELLDKTSSANVENKLLGLMNKTGLAHAPEKEEICITRSISCMSQAKVPHVFVLQITRGPAFKNNSTEHQMLINVYPPLILENTLPFAIQFSDPNNQIVINLDSGEAVPVYGVQPKKSVVFHFTGIPNFPTSKHVLINYESSPPTFSQKIRLVDPSHTHASLDLLLFTKEEAPGVYKITVYSSVWLINNTQLALLYKVPKVYEMPETQRLSLAPGQSQQIAEQVDDKPFLYAHDKLKIQVPGSTWSKKFSVATVGKIIVVQMFASGSDHHTEYRFRVSIRFGEGKFQKTKMVTFSPHYVIVNLMSVPLMYRQSQAKLGIVKDPYANDDSVSHSTLGAGESTFFHWPDDENNKHLLITRSDGNHDWSGPFAIDDVGDCTLKLRHRHKQQSYFPRTEVIDSPTSVFVLIHPEDPAHPPFIIENMTDRTIRYMQEGDSHTDSLGSGERASYAWDQPLDRHALLVDCWGEKGEHGRMRCKISKIVPFKPLKVEQQTIYGYMHVSGPTRVLTLTHDQRLYESQGAQWDGSGGLVEQGEWDISVNIPGVGISLVDGTPKELLHWSIHGISAMYAKSNIYTTAEMVFDFMQIDNQLPQTDYPVLLYHTKPKTAEEKHRPFLHFSFVRRMNVELNFFEYAGLLVQEINIMLEDSLLNSILDMVLSLSHQLQNNQTFSQSRNTKKAIKKKALYSSTPQSGNVKMIYFKLLHLNPIKVVLSFTFVPNGILSQSSNFLGNFGMTFGQLERAPICLNALLLEHPFTPRRPLASRIKAHYIRQSLNQLYKAVGSSETFGNPVGLFNNLGTGFKDFFYEPAQGFVKSPQEFGKGLAKGSVSLLKHSVYGMFNTISKITGAFGKGLALLSLDPEYLNHRRTSERKQPKHLGEGLMMGAQGLGLGIFDGVTGVVRKPIEGALHSGASGFAKGVVQGVVGVAVKPVAGVMDLATKTTEGIKNTTNLFKDKRRVRPPRAFAKGRVLIEYTLDESEGRYILDCTNEGLFKQDDLLYNMHHDQHITVITNRRVMCVKSKNYNFIFQVPFDAIKRVEMVAEGVTLHFFEAQPILIFLDRRNRFTIEIADKDQILLLCIMLRDCIRAAGM